jgi:hypothetical protein
MRYFIGFQLGIIFMGWATVLAGTPPDNPLFGTGCCLLVVGIGAAFLHAQRSPVGASPNREAP